MPLNVAVIVTVPAREAHYFLHVELNDLSSLSKGPRSVGEVFFYFILLLKDKKKKDFFTQVLTVQQSSL